MGERGSNPTVPARRFPTDFVWGAATAAYQIEGATAAAGRGESIWDRFARTPGRTWQGQTGDVACDHYNRYREDVALAAELGLTAYRFSVAWPRVIPDGVGAVNEAGLDFYDRLVDRLLECGVEPYLTLYHWDLPQALEDAGGWPVRGTAEAFASYAEVVAGRLADRVRHFATINEPHCVSDLGYRTGEHAPGRTDEAASLAAAHHVLVGHGLAMQAMRAVAPKASLGIVLNFEPKQPASGHPLDLEAASAAHDRMNRWFLDPLTGRGYPPDGVRGAGWRQAEVQPNDMDLIAAPVDFMGVNYYTRQVCRSALLPALPRDEEPERTGMGWEVYPAGLTQVLGFVASRTGGLPLYVTENGAAYPVDEADPTLDPERVGYLARHLEAALDTLQQGVPLRGYFSWSLLDNFEWAHGYRHRFGLIHIDYETQQRLVRQSGRYLAEVARSGSLAAPAANV
ncbi:MAG TPA: GH1 family beta-glucosidase [Candidatus Limnocylindria bacterium]|nr:GH1 family beta-glucosidase [Candidatus Limnocylindria bacterium]